MTLQTNKPIEHQHLDATNRLAEELARLVVEGTITLDAPYQRGAVWTVDQRRRLIESWLRGLPVPAVIVNARYQAGWPISSPSYACIDGKQRLHTAVAWFSGDLDVPASWFEPDRIDTTHETDDGPYVNYNELTVPGRRYTGNRFALPMAAARVRTLAEEAAIFLLVNGGGVAQETATMERATQIAAGVDQ